MALPTLDAVFASAADVPRRYMLAQWLVNELGSGSVADYITLPERYLWAKIAVAAGAPLDEASYISLPKQYVWKDIYDSVSGSSLGTIDWSEKQALGHIAAAYRGDTGNPANLATYIDWPWRYQVASIITALSASAGCSDAEANVLIDGNLLFQNGEQDGKPFYENATYSLNWNSEFNQWIYDEKGVETIDNGGGGDYPWLASWSVVTAEKSCTPNAIIVSGAGSEIVNGTYTFQGTSWVKEANVATIEFDEESGWGFPNWSEGEVDGKLYVAQEEAEFPWQTGYDPADGENPAPTLTPTVL
jgi:hypothetical protein